MLIFEEPTASDHGRLMLNNMVGAIRETLGNRQVMRLTFASPIDDLCVVGCRTRRIADAVFEIDFAHRQCAPNQLLMQVAQQHTVVDMSLIEPDIEEISRNLYLKNKQPDAL